MKIQPIYYTGLIKSKTENKNNSTSNPAFQGWHLSLAGTNAYKTQRQFFEACSNWGSQIGVPASRVADLMNKAGKDRISFFKKMVNQYRNQNYFLEEYLKEDPELLISIFKSIKKPQPEHLAIVSRSNGTFEQLEKIFSLAEDKKSLGLVQTLQHDILPQSQRSYDVMIELLQSPNAKLYAENIANYTSYLKLNFEDKNVVKNLDSLISAGKFDRNAFDTEYAVKKLLAHKTINQYLSGYEKELKEFHNNDREHFLRKLCHDFLVYKDYGKQVQGSDIMDMYKTTTPENFQVRRNVLDAFKYHQAKSVEDNGFSEFINIKTLFDKMDENEEIMQFVKKAMNGNLKVSSVEELMSIINTVPTQKANIFFKNLRRIVRESQGEERKNALINDLENPFYESKANKFQKKQSIRYGFSRPESKFSKLKRYLENKINLYRYNKLGEGEINPVAITESRMIKPAEHKVNFIPVKTYETTGTHAENQVTLPALNLTRYIKTSPAAKKLIVIKDVNEIIKTKLGAKTLERQEEAYAQNATKMRLKLLPEIFNSIKDTRKVKRTSADNRDALRLYSRIKGNNRKLIRYMLLKENADGTRMFNVKEIINFVDKANAQIDKNKKLNKAYRAADAKAYYEELFQNMVQENGKLKISRKKKAA